MAHYDGTNKVLDVPGVGTLRLPGWLHELRGKPIEQFGMARPFALRTQIVQHLGKARSEELLPHPVDKNPSGQRILGRYQPVGEVETTRAAATCVQFSQKHRNGRLDNLA